MKLYQKRTTQIISCSLSEAWRFFSNPFNLSKITPKAMCFEIISKDVSKTIYPGMIIEYSVKPFPYWKTTWITEITHVVEKSLFVDEQRIGPYSFWHHQHHFREIKQGVEMEDIISYALPLKSLGRLLHKAVACKLEQIFTHRRDIIDSLSLQRKETPS